MPRLALAVLAASLGLAATPIGLPASQAQPNPNQVQPDQEPVISVDFKGGTVTQYIEALKKSGKPVNVVTSDRASKQQLAPVSLKDVTVGVAVVSIQAAATSSSGAWRIEPIMVRSQFPRQFSGVAALSSETFSVDFHPSGKRGEDVVVESYSLQKILRPDGKGEGANPQVVLTAIETGLKLQNEDSDQPPDLKFHADSGLLFVRGTKADVHLVGSIVSRMSEDASRRMTAAERLAQEDAMRSIATKEAKLEVQLREMELASATRQFEEVKKLVEKGASNPTDLSRFEVEVARARFNLEKAKLGLEKAQIMRLDSNNEANQSTLEALAAQNAALRKQLDDSQGATKELPKSPARSGAR